MWVTKFENGQMMACKPEYNALTGQATMINRIHCLTISRYTLNGIIENSEDQKIIQNAKSCLLT